MANVLERKMREYDESEIPVPQDLLNAATALSKTVSAIGALNNTQVVARKFAAELKAKQEAKLSELQADGEKQGITIEFMNRIRTEVLGLE
jgi:flagellar biosynthesis regulator FlaF